MSVQWGDYQWVYDIVQWEYSPLNVFRLCMMMNIPTYWDDDDGDDDDDYDDYDYIIYIYTYKYYIYTIYIRVK